MRNDQSGPHIAAAFLCEKVLREHDGVLSFIRVVDRFTVPAPTEQAPKSTIQATLVVSFKTGSLPVGRYSITVRPQKPDGESLPVATSMSFFDGVPEGGVNLIAPMGLVVNEEGLYWIDVLFQDAIMTRIPLRILFQTAPSTSQAQ